MKKTSLILSLLLLFLVSCGPSQQEKERIADKACAEIMETRKFESSKRIQVLNDARFEVGDYDSVYPMDDDFLWSSLSLGGRQSCIDSIIKPPPPPKKTKAQKEGEEAAALAAEEAKLKKEEEERIAAEEAEREAEERKKYVLENQVSTYLYCPIVGRNPMFHQNIYYLLINLNKLDGELIESEIYTMYKTAKKEDRSYFKRYGCDSSDKDLTSRPSYIRKPEPCSVISTKEDTFGDGSFIYVNIEEVLSSGWIKTNFIPIERIYERREDSTSYGHKILKFGSIDSFVEPVLDRVDLGAAIDSFELGDNGSPYQCEVTSKEIYEAKIQEQQNLVDDLVETTKKEKAEREAQKTQI